MLEKGFMSEIRKYEKISLGETENLFINIFSVPNSKIKGKPSYSYSAYEIFSVLKKMGKPMAYKNVHKRVSRLHTLGLIKEVEKSGRNAIKYELTTHGLFERLMIGPAVDLIFLERNRRNVILQTILYQYFEEQTIREFEDARYHLAFYLKSCCQAVLTAVKSLKPQLDDLDRRFLEWQEDLRENKLRPNFEELGNSYTEGMENLIMGQIRNFVFKIVDGAKYEYLERHRREPRKYLTSFPTELLKNDKRFIPILSEMKKDFDCGCNVLLLENSSKIK